MDLYNKTASLKLRRTTRQELKLFKCGSYMLKFPLPDKILAAKF